MPTEIIALSVLYGFMFGCVYKVESVCWSQNNFMKWFALWHYIKGSAVRIGINWESQKKKKMYSTYILCYEQDTIWEKGEYRAI